MKNLITLLLLVVGLTSFSQTERELQMISEINLVRTNPTSYIPKVKSYITSCNKKLKKIEEGKLRTSSSDGLTGKEVIERQIKAAKELINVLGSIKPLIALVFNDSMQEITEAHGQYLKTINSTSHKSSNGDLAPQRMKGIANNVTENIATDNGMISPTVLMLLVDAGIEGRGHRNNILNPDSKFISVYTNGDVWVQNFAN